MNPFLVDMLGPAGGAGPGAAVDVQEGAGQRRAVRRREGHFVLQRLGRGRCGAAQGRRQVPRCPGPRGRQVDPHHPPQDQGPHGRMAPRRQGRRQDLPRFRWLPARPRSPWSAWFLMVPREAHPVGQRCARRSKIMRTPSGWSTLSSVRSGCSGAAVPGGRGRKEEDEGGATDETRMKHG